MAEIVNIEGIGLVQVEDPNNLSEEELSAIESFKKEEDYVPIPAPIAGPDIEAARALPEEGFPALSERFTERHEMLPKMRVDRPAFSMVGAGAGRGVGTVAGAVGGTPLGPAGQVGGALIAGEALESGGAAAGSLVFDIVDEVTRNLQGAPSAPGAGLEQSVKYAGQEAAYEAGGGAAARLLKYPLAGAKSLARSALGLASPAARDIANMAQRMGAPMGIVHATGRSYLKGATRVLGVVPFVGGPLVNSKKVVSENISKWAAETFDYLAPGRTKAILGQEYTEEIIKKFGKVSEVSAAMFEEYYKAANKLKNPNIVPTINMRNMARKIIKEQDAHLVDLTTGVKESDQLPSSTLKWLREVAAFPEAISPTQYRDKILKLRGLVAKDVKNNVPYIGDYATRMKPAMEMDFNHPVIDYLAEPEGRAVVKKLKEANKFFHKGMQPFETTQMKKFGQVEKGIFDTFADFGAANRQADTASFFDTLFNNQSITGLKQLREGIGQEKFLKGTRAWLDNALNGPQGAKIISEETGDVSYSIGKLKKNLGLDDPSKREALQEMLKGTGVDIKDWDNFAEIVQSAQSFKIPAVSVFIQRRVTLGGLSALYTVAAAGQSSMTGTLLALALMRGGAKVLTKPESLQSMVRAFDDSIPNQERRKLVLRTFRQILGPKAGSEEPTTADRKWAKEAADAVATAYGTTEETLQTGRDIAVPDVVKDLVKSISSSTMDKINQALE